MKTTNMKTTSAIPPVESTSVRTVGSINPNENAVGEHTHVKTMGVKTMSTTQLQMPLKSTSMKTMSAISPHENAHGERKREEDEREDDERAGRR